MFEWAIALTIFWAVLIERRMFGRIVGVAQERKHLRQLESVETSRRKRGRGQEYVRQPCNLIAS